MEIKIELEKCHDDFMTKYICKDDVLVLTLMLVNLMEVLDLKESQ